MKKFLFLFLISLTSISTFATNYYVATSGSDSNSGTLSSPFKTITKAISVVSAGDYIYMRGGLHSISSSPIVITKNGSSTSKIRVFAYGSEVPVLRFNNSEGDSNRGIVLDGDYWHWKGITIERAGDNGMLLSGSNNTIENCIFRNNFDTGLQLSRYSSSATNISQWPSNNLILGCESYDNRDSANEDADGFAAKLTVGTGNVFRNCISHHNIDDGWDLYTKSDTGPIGIVTLEGCIAHNNGILTTGGTSGGGDKNGYKLGSSAHQINHIVRRCIAYKNGKHGFTDNGNIGAIEFTNNTSYDNDGYNWHTRDGASHIFRNNISFENSTNDRLRGNTLAPNSFVGATGGFTVTSSDFETLSIGSNANPTSNGFLKLKSGSDLIDAGVTSSGITYNGSKPDLGAIEYGGTVTPPGNPEIILSATAGNSLVNLNWTINNLTVTGLEVYRDTDSNPSGRVRIAQISTSTRSYVDNGVTSGITYYYWIKANGSVNSNAASATPNGSSSGGGGSNTGNEIHNFTVSEKNSSFYTISGNMNSNDGLVNYNGLSLTKRLKIESSTSITFTASSNATLTLVFDSNFTGDIKVDNVSYTASSGTATISISNGFHTISKDDVANLYYISTAYSSNNNNKITDEIDLNVKTTDQMIVYPNPSHNNVLNINLSKINKKESLSIINMLGIEVLKVNDITNRNTIDISNLVKGTYIIKHISDSNSETKTFIKE
ncbi:T9SS type A sorting domain-containing protein [Flavobacterium jejuense]|uniref:T9SS type A sorting domain-containing protein n=1 Tax=Flavobacterium jejuense TaxID=1544455 RepID=A0ABX0ISK9_9FLAO|nr:T9SS type A sorting domain-containing protein [Flavobacterium jejuense]NHN25827.1 T9SS type A sorting domain-containing protein [Flavobacterium jejuense]